VSRLLVVTGLSGAGKSTALGALADVGWSCVDNLPVPLLLPLVETLQGVADERIAVGVDARTRAYLASFPTTQQQLADAGHELEILFLTAPSGVILQRFAETRRAHPLGALPAGVEQERELLATLAARATVTIDTATLTARQLRNVVRDRWGGDGSFHVVVQSFGFKFGVPSEADLVLDARFLGNPFDRAELRALTGHDTPVAEFVLEQPDAQGLLERIEGLVRFQAPRSLREGRSSLTVAIGCTGGQHRSVALVEALRHRLDGGPGLTDPPARITVAHRDVSRYVHV
jgi:UPF0042 nucleotide-binding protein